MFWVASQNENIFTWQQAGIVNEIKFLGKWLGAIPKKQLIKDGYKEEYDSWADKKVGDRKTNLVMIGSGLDKKAITKALDDCLLTDPEFKK